jgi:hypothetical protein
LRRGQQDMGDVDRVTRQNAGVEAVADPAGLRALSSAPFTNLSA